ncbi:hypothetical protein [Rhodopila sp.]|uniref:hypothetical protein n=1 Tax=Rhodopila sp. TaxID=2480087 RepID=UPI003D13AE33
MDRRIDQILAGIENIGNRFDDLEAGFNAVLSALRDQQVPMLKTQIEKLDQLIEAVDHEPSGELEETLASLARAVNGMNETIQRALSQKPKDDC